VQGETDYMLLRHRSTDHITTPAGLSPGFEHLDRRSVTTLRRLVDARLDFVLIGPVAHAIRGELTARGAVAIVPAPYLRNRERLVAAVSAHGEDLVVESADGVRYQELLYEAARIEIARGIEVQVAAPEDLEHFSHLRRTGTAPEFRITRTAGEVARVTEPPDSSPDA
jgi:hypothetical protein